MARLNNEQLVVCHVSFLNSVHGINVSDTISVPFSYFVMPGVQQDAVILSGIPILLLNSMNFTLCVFYFVIQIFLPHNFFFNHPLMCLLIRLKLTFDCVRGAADKSM